MIIGFTKNTSKFISKLLCKKFRHCVVIFAADEVGIAQKDKFILAQIAADGVKLVCIGAAEMQRLKSAGWVFVRAPMRQRASIAKMPSLLSCVGFAKRALAINKPLIWTPDQLYRYLAE
jgi:hypothetical protein